MAEESELADMNPPYSRIIFAVNQYDLFFTGASRYCHGRGRRYLGRTTFMASFPQSDSLWVWADGLGDPTNIFTGVGKRRERRHMAACLPGIAGNHVPPRPIDPDVLHFINSVFLFRRFHQKPDVREATSPDHPPHLIVHLGIDHRVSYPVLPS